MDRIVARKEKAVPSTPEERIAARAPAWAWRRPPILTDPIDMEFAIELGDPQLQKQLMATRLETLAKVYQSMAEGATKAAQVVAKKSGGQR